MKYLLGLFILLFSVSANSNSVIISEGIGKTFESAKQAAFKEAIRMRVGVALSSSTEVKNQNLISNEIIEYSSGYIKNYEIIESFMRNDNFIVIMKVEVDNSRIHNRLISGNKSKGEIDGEKNFDQYSSVLKETESSKKLISSVLSDYPNKAFNVDYKNGSFSVDNNRNARITIPYQVVWNKNYLVSFSDTMKTVQDSDNNSFIDMPKSMLSRFKEMFERNPNGVGTKYDTYHRNLINQRDIPRDYPYSPFVESYGYVYLDNLVHRFNNEQKFNEIKNFFYNIEVVMMTTLRDSNENILYKKCDIIPNKKFFTLDLNRLYFHPHGVFNGTFELIVSPNSSLHDKLKYMKRFDMQIVNTKMC